jgi:hypothetical protein
VLALLTFAFAGDLPDSAKTPGATNPLITQENIGQTICAGAARWSTKSIRPTEGYTTALKRLQLASYDYASRNVKLYEEDHLISLEIGGHPTDPRNLWPEAWAGTWGAHVKDRLENRLHALVCSKTIALDEAQKAIATDWIAAYHKYMPKGKVK